MDFVAKHLPDKFYLEGDQRVSVRGHVFREIIGNILIHREYSNAYPAKLIIEKDAVIKENWNKPYNQGNIDPSNFTPFPKNPMIARFFKEIGWVDELGSGVRNVFKYTELYTPKTKPEFIEEDVFKTIIPLVTKVGRKTVEETVEEIILNLIKSNPSVTAREMEEATGLSRRGVEYNLDKMKKANVIKREGSTKTGVWVVLN
jgi:ATP-dependent DNA helicase RecG